MSYSEMAQLELMNAAANVASQEDLDALRLTLSLFFARRAQQAIDKMWDEGTFDQKKGSPVKPCVGIWINPINLQNQLNHPKGVCFYINKFLRND